MKVRIILITLITALSLYGCKLDSDDSDDTRDDVTCTVNLGVNLPASAPDGGPDFDRDNPLSYSGSVSMSMYDIAGQMYIVSAYFLKSNNEQSIWDIYFFYDDVPIDIEGGSIGSQQQLTAQFAFNEVGELETIAPEFISSGELILNDEDYYHTINFLFEELITTQYDSGFAVTSSGANCALD